MFYISNIRLPQGSKIETYEEIYNVFESHLLSPKKIRHALKDLCFYSPTPKMVAPLISILHRELISPSKCIKLVCYHVITHSSFIQATSHLFDLMNALTNAIKECKIKQIRSVAKVFYTISSIHPIFNVHNIEAVKNTISSTRLRDAVKAKNMSNFHKPELQLIIETLHSLKEIPGGEEAFRNIFKTTNSQDCFKTIYKEANIRYKQLIVETISRSNYLNEIFSSIVNLDDKVVLYDARCIGFMMINYDNYEEKINELLKRSPFPYVKLLQLKMCEANVLTPNLYDSITKNIISNDLFLLPLHYYLQKSPRMTYSPEMIHKVYKSTNENNISVAFLSFLCIHLMIDANEWLCGVLEELFIRMNTEQKTTAISMLLNTWANVINYQDDFERLVVTMLKLIFIKYGSFINPRSLDHFLSKIIENNLCDKYIKLMIKILKKTKEIDSIIFIITSSRQIKDYTSPIVYEKFFERCKATLNESEPELRLLFINK